MKLGLSRKRRGKTGFSTDARVLQAIRDEHQIIPKIERWRELTKLAKTYLDALPALIGADGRLHTTFQQTNAATGRLSSINPNLQNIPVRTELGREIRACFVAEPGNVLISADYSQVELRVLAHIAGEDVLREIFRRGEDVHTATAARGVRHGARRARRGHALEGQDGQLRDRLRAVGATAWPTGCGSRRRRRRSSSTATSSASRRSPQFMADAIDAGRRSRATSRRCSAAAGRSPSCARATGRRASWASAWPSTPSSRARRRTSSSWRWSARTTRSRRPAWRRALILQIHDELLFEGPEAEVGARCGDRRGGDGRRRRARSAAGGRRRHRAQLARRQVVRLRRCGTWDPSTLDFPCAAARLRSWA